MAWFHAARSAVKGPMGSIWFNGDGETWVASTNLDITVNALTGKTLGTRPEHGYCSHAEVSLAHDRIVLTHNHGSILKYYHGKFSTGGNTALAESSHSASTHNISLAPDACCVAIGIGGEIRLFNLSTGRYKVIGAGGHPRWSPDGTRIAYVGSENTKLMIVAEVSGRILNRLEMDDTIEGYAASSIDSRYLLVKTAYSPSWFCYAPYKLTAVRLHDLRRVDLMTSCEGAVIQSFGWVKGLRAATGF